MKTRPEQIDTTQHFWDAFGNTETEVSAMWIVKFCQARGNWESFTFEEIDAFYKAGWTPIRKQRTDPGQFIFNGLTGDRREPDGRLTVAWIVKDKAERFHITEAFVEACYKASPRRITAWARISSV